MTSGPMPLTLFDVGTEARKHPAPYPASLYPAMARMLAGRTRILDPFAGKGGIFRLHAWLPTAQIDAVELEPEWAAADPRITQGNALSLPWPDGYFDAVCTSPTYGNRLCDNYVDGSKRITYRAYLARPLHPDNSGQWGFGRKYQEFHRQAWTEARRVLLAGGAFVLNIKDFYRDGKVIPVTQWHIGTLEGLGFRLTADEPVHTPSARYGANRDLRVDYESVLLFELDK